MSLLPWIQCNSSLVVSDETLIKFMTDGVLLKEVEKVGRYIVQLVLLGVSMLL